MDGLAAPDCATNRHVWNAKWKDTRALQRTARSGDLLALRTWSSIAIFDIADHANVKPLGAVEIPRTTTTPEEESIAWDGATLIAATNKGWMTVNAADPAKPSTGAEVTLGAADRVRPIAARDGIVYFGLYGSAEGIGEREGLCAGTDAAAVRFDPLHPAEIAVLGSTLLVVGDRRLSTWSLATPSTPSRLASIDARVRYDVRLAVSPDLATVVAVPATEHDGAWRFDLRDPAKPVASALELPDDAQAAHVAHDGTIRIVTCQYKKRLDLHESATSTLLTTDPELTQGVIWLDCRGDSLLLLARSGRFAHFRLR